MKNRVKLHDKCFEVMITQEQIAAAVERVAAQINRDYAGRPTPVFIGVLNGSFMFMSDVIRLMEFECELSFIKLASYRGTSTTGDVCELIGLSQSLEGRDVIIIEDIVDTGNSIEHLTSTLEAERPASVKICTLFFKPQAYQKEIPIDYVALEIGNEFIVGYGLDYDQIGRNLKDIYVVCDE